MKQFTIHWKGFCKNSAFDWYFCLSCFVVILVIVILADMYVYAILLKETGTQGIPNSTQNVTLNKASVDDMATKLRTKDATPHIVPQSVLRDPSL
jgi:hypothetical protein